MAYEEARELIMNSIMRNACIPKDKDWWNNALLVAVEALEKMSALKDGLDSLKKDLQKAYKLNDASLSYVLKGNAMSELECRAEEFSLMMMQDLSWLIDTIEGVE